MNSKVIIFDFDGTLADTAQRFVEIVDELSIKYKFNPIDALDLEEMRNHTILDLVFNYCHIPVYKLPFILREFRKKLASSALETNLFPGTEELLVELKKRGYKLGLITSSSSKIINPVLAKFSLEKCFDFVSTSAPTYHKDRVLHKVIKKYGFKLDDVFYVGDELRDVRACHKVNVKCVAVSWGFSSAKLLSRLSPYKVVSNFEEFISLFP